MKIEYRHTTPRHPHNSPLHIIFCLLFVLLFPPPPLCTIQQSVMSVCLSVSNSERTLQFVGSPSPSRSRFFFVVSYLRVSVSLNNTSLPTFYHLRLNVLLTKIKKKNTKIGLFTPRSLVRSTRRFAKYLAPHPTSEHTRGSTSSRQFFSPIG